MYSSMANNGNKIYDKNSVVIFTQIIYPANTATLVDVRLLFIRRLSRKLHIGPTSTSRCICWVELLQGIFGLTSGAYFDIERITVLSSYVRKMVGVTPLLLRTIAYDYFFLIHNNSMIIYRCYKCKIGEYSVTKIVTGYSLYPYRLRVLRVIVRPL